MTVSIVVPVYNGETTLAELVRQIKATLAGNAAAYEILLVNDGSADRSWARIGELAAANPEVVGIDLARNSGQHNALLAGIRAARYDVIVTLDDDLQNPPSEVPKLIAALGDSADVVYGVPDALQHGWWRNLASTASKWALTYFMGAATARTVSAFRAFRTRVRDAFADYRGPLVSIDVLLTWGTAKFGSVRVAHDPRRSGQSHYTFWKLLTHAMNMLTGFSAAPLRFASYVGFAFLIFGVVILVFVVGRYVLSGGSTAPGFPFLASIVTIFAGAQLFALGIMGEYLARIHFRTMDRPSYTVKAIVGAAGGRDRS